MKADSTHDLQSLYGLIRYAHKQGWNIETLREDRPLLFQEILDVIQSDILNHAVAELINFNRNNMVLVDVETEVFSFEILKEITGNMRLTQEQDLVGGFE